MLCKGVQFAIAHLASPLLSLSRFSLILRFDVPNLPSKVPSSWLAHSGYEEALMAVLCALRLARMHAVRTRMWACGRVVRA